jgi:EAL domain-containing protein (putative c-di-GMP-specific phosphodiesterase class I)
LLAQVGDPAGTERVLKRLQESGVKVAVDDFGTGFTSLSQLAHLPLDQIKIDRSFIQGPSEDPQYRAIVRSIINLSHDLGLEVVAEGIETKELLDELVALECDLYQGYYFAKPLAPDGLVAWLEGKTDESTVRAA